MAGNPTYAKIFVRKWFDDYLTVVRANFSSLHHEGMERCVGRKEMGTPQLSRAFKCSACQVSIVEKLLQFTEELNEAVTKAAEKVSPPLKSSTLVRAYKLWRLPICCSPFGFICLGRSGAHFYRALSRPHSTLR